MEFNCPICGCVAYSVERYINHPCEFLQYKNKTGGNYLSYLVKEYVGILGYKKGEE